MEIIIIALSIVVESLNDGSAVKSRRRALFASYTVKKATELMQLVDFTCLMQVYRQVSSSLLASSG